MNLTEDRLRTALGETAAEVPPGSLRSLTLPPDTAATGSSAVPTKWRGSARRRMKILAIPAAAAVAVVAVIAASLALAGGSGRLPHPAGTGSLLHRVPRYYMELIYAKPTAVADEAVIRDTLTGATIATVHPPSPFSTFSLLVGARDDRTFVLGAQRTGGRSVFPATQLFSARFNPASRSIRLTALLVPVFPTNTDVDGVALSPSGTQVAVALTTYIRRGRRIILQPQIRIYSLTGSPSVRRDVEVWRARTTGYIVPRLPSSPQYTAMSWARTGVLAFIWKSASGSGVRLLDTSDSGSSLLADSRLAVADPRAGNATPWYDEILSTNGTTIATVWNSSVLEKFSGQFGKLKRIEAEFEEFSATTGKLIRTLWPTYGSEGGARFEPGSLPEELYWSSSSGSVLVVRAPATHAARSPSVLGVLSGNKFVPIPRAAVLLTSVLAF